jgi:hypothetical protein
MMKKILISLAALAAMTSAVAAAPKGSISNVPGKWAAGWNFKQCSYIQLGGGAITIFNTDGTTLNINRDLVNHVIAAYSACEKGSYYAQVDNINAVTPNEFWIAVDH